MITEGSCTIDTTALKIPTKQMDVFYNPVMKHNRDVFIALLDAQIDTVPKSIALAMEGTGVRGVRTRCTLTITHPMQSNAF
jgi:tRNA G26 N,N-dimethylase Trm1